MGLRVLLVELVERADDRVEELLCRAQQSALVYFQLVRRHSARIDLPCHSKPKRSISPFECGRMARSTNLEIELGHEDLCKKRLQVLVEEGTPDELGEDRHHSTAERLVSE